MNIGDRLLFLLKERRMTQKALSSATNLTPSYVNQICLGRKIPTLETLALICNALEITLGDFFSVSPAQLSAEELQLLESYRLLTRREQTGVLSMLRVLSNIPPDHSFKR